MICTFTLCLLHIVYIVYQKKQFKVNNGYFFIDNQSNIFLQSLKVSIAEPSVRKANLIWID